MKIEGRYTFEVPREVVWKAVIDPQVLARVMPGAEDFKVVAENEFEGTLKIKIGPVQGKFKGKVKLSDLIEPASYRMKINGKGPPGFIDATGEVRLEEDGASTVLHYDIDAKVGGRIASVGQRLIDSSSKVITRQSLEALAEQVKVASGDLAPGEEPAAPSAKPSQAEFAADFAKGMADELVPPARRPWIAAAAVAVLAGVFFAVRSCG